MRFHIFLILIIYSFIKEMGRPMFINNRILLVFWLAMVPIVAWASESPCTVIQRACGEAGFTRDLPEGRDLMTKCFKPILAGQQIANVQADPDTVKQCNAQQSASPPTKKRRRF
jgi:hypothetical protein